MKTLLLTALSLIAFAANSVLCRLALKGDAIDPVSFTVVRLLAGAAVLAILMGLSRSGGGGGCGGGWGSWRGAAMLFAYAIAFSLAYVSLDAGTGALVLFGAVQLSMVLVGYFKGQPLRPVEWLGLILASTGIVYLVLPGLSTPSAAGFLLMALSGVAWGLYTLNGKGSRQPLADTAGNFLRTIPMTIVLAAVGVVASMPIAPSPAGVWLAVISGGLTSGLGYAIWYQALAGLSATQAAVVQLTVPILAALGGVVVLSEALSLRLLIAAVLVLGGILLVTLGKGSRDGVFKSKVAVEREARH